MKMIRCQCTNTFGEYVGSNKTYDIYINPVSVASVYQCSMTRVVRDAPDVDGWLIELTTGTKHFTTVFPEALVAENICQQ